MCVTDFARTYSFYTSRFNFAPSDVSVTTSPPCAHNSNVSQLVHDENDRNITTFLHLDRGSELVDHHCFFFFEGPKCHVHHSSYETFDFDTQLLGHDYLREKGYENCWGLEDTSWGVKFLTIGISNPHFLSLSLSLSLSASEDLIFLLLKYRIGSTPHASS